VCIGDIPPSLGDIPEMHTVSTQSLAIATKKLFLNRDGATKFNKAGNAAKIAV